MRVARHERASRTYTRSILGELKTLPQFDVCWRLLPYRRHASADWKIRPATTMVPLKVRNQSRGAARKRRKGQNDEEKSKRRRTTRRAPRSCRRPRKGIVEIEGKVMGANGHGEESGVSEPCAHGRKRAEFQDALTAKVADKTT